MRELLARMCVGSPNNKIQIKTHRENKYGNKFKPQLNFPSSVQKSWLQKNISIPVLRVKILEYSQEVLV